jgi:hypothetical protein
MGFESFGEMKKRILESMTNDPDGVYVVSGNTCSHNYSKGCIVAPARGEHEVDDGAGGYASLSINLSNEVIVGNYIRLTTGNVKPATARDVEEWFDNDIHVSPKALPIILGE